MRVKARKIERRDVGKIGEDRGGVENSAVFVHGVRRGSHDDCEDISFEFDMAVREDVLC